MVSVVSIGITHHPSEVETQVDQRDIQQGLERHKPDWLSIIPYVFSWIAGQAPARHCHLCWYVSCPLASLSCSFNSLAQCLYVLTDDNRPISDEVKTNGAYTTCLLSIIRGDEEARKANVKGKDVSDDRETTLRVLCTGE